PLHMPSTVDAINGWCRTNTDNMIEKILEYDDVDESTTMILLNALCFEALWSDQYQDYQCRKAEFHGETETTEVTMMYSEEYGYISGANETGFAKRYEGGKYAFVALLPNEGMSMSEYLATLTGERFLSLVDERKGAVDAGLPKFTFDWSDSLVPALQKLGMVTVFTGQSDLSGLGYYDDDAPLYISDVIHKTHIEVEESGTKAAAVTAVIVNKATAVNPAEIKKVILDRPFIYAIVDTATNLPVFLGCVTDLPAA
ncbi:MAG: proteinase inhibitor I4 serpin, partial [Clostridia bacterium]|nr:proteinase inhibitor I4 serpin [Clostridia bacterium]